MNNTIYFLIFPLLIISCSNPDKKPMDTTSLNNDQKDQLVVKKNITDELAGSAYRKRATGYSVVENKDTSDFMIVFSELKHGGKVRIRSHYDKYGRRGKLYEDRIREFEKILPVAKNDYNFDSLSAIDIGRLISTGDLAVDISKEYIEKYGNDFQVTDYQKIADFLMGSKLTRDIDRIIGPYSKQVERIEIEKVFFTTKEDLFQSSLIETDSTQIPDRILDCMTWIILKQK